MPARSDEGMWLLDEPPKDRLRTKYNFELSENWLRHARLASIRFNSGGSGSFVSPDGLIVTNHHIGADSLQKLSNPERNLLRDGFLARKRADELKCPDMELNVLQEVVDVTVRVDASVRPTMTAPEAFAARRATMSGIEKESLDATGLRSDVVTLYQGGAYHLYRYKKYTDVRLVMAPELGIAFFGGDTDNFEFPRYNLDICFFRAYENDAPVKAPHFFKWSATGPAEGDLVFVTGHPGTTNRQETYARLKHRRDVTLPYNLARLRLMEAVLTQYSERGPAERLVANGDLHRFANARKAFTGQYQGLLDPAIMRAKLASEVEMIRGFRELKGPMGIEGVQAVVRIERLQGVLASIEKPWSLLERGDAFGSELVSIARQIVRLNAELLHPSAERLREYRDSNLESLKFQLLSPAPISAELERIKIVASLGFMAENLGGDHPLLLKILAGQSPSARADELIAGSKLIDPKARKALIDGGATALDASADAMILFARLIDGEARALRKRYEEDIEEPERQSYGSIARAKFAIHGRTLPPDATFTLRLAYGVVRGYRADGQDVPWKTTFDGAFARAERQQNREPFALPARWLDGRKKLDGTTAFDFVSTADTIGGNSGSPVLNRAGEFVGINFDRNRYGLVRNFVYTDEQARHIAVHSGGILEALRKLYDCPELLAELLGDR